MILGGMCLKIPEQRLINPADSRWHVSEDT
jgi:hypothetical protein